MSKAFLGPRLRRLREGSGLSQLAVARDLGVSASYYSQLESNQRALTPTLLAKISTVFAVDVHYFSEEEEGRLLVDLRESLTASAPEEAISNTELRELASNLPGVARALVQIHRRHRAALERVEAVANRLGDRAPEIEEPLPLMPYEEVRDFFYAHHNYFAVLDEHAERLALEIGLEIGDALPSLSERLTKKHGVRVVRAAASESSPFAQRSYDKKQRVLRLASTLRPHQRAFQIATQLAFLEAGDQIRGLARGGKLSSDEARTLAHVGLAHHFAGALLMPYGLFLEAADRLRYDIELLGRNFGVGFETACHRLSSLQRPQAPGVPFFFLRVDRAGNISKRQSATDFHFSRVGGTCPLWNVYEAFARPERILTQLAQMPDGRTYLWIARTVSRGSGGFRAPSKTFAVALGCDVRHAERLVYSQGLDLKDPLAATPIGMGCKVCERRDCPQRAFPPIGRKLTVDENESRFDPYPVT